MLPNLVGAQVQPQPRASQAPVVSAAVSKRVGTASRTTEAPVIDGLLDERLWQAAAPLTGFVQTEPLEGEPASERTEVRISLR